MNCKQFYASKKKSFALIAERARAIPPPNISKESDLPSESEDEFPLCGDTDNEAVLSQKIVILMVIFLLTQILIKSKNQLMVKISIHSSWFLFFFILFSSIQLK